MEEEIIRLNRLMLIRKSLALDMFPNHILEDKYAIRNTHSFITHYSVLEWNFTVSFYLLCNCDMALFFEIRFNFY